MKKLFGAALVGAALGALATKFLSSPKGKKAKAELEKKARKIYDTMKSRVKDEWQDFETSAKKIKSVAKNALRERK